MRPKRRSEASEHPGDGFAAVNDGGHARWCVDNDEDDDEEVEVCVRRRKKQRTRWLVRQCRSMGILRTKLKLPDKTTHGLAD